MRLENLNQFAVFEITDPKYTHVPGPFLVLDKPCRIPICMSLADGCRYDMHSSLDVKILHQDARPVLGVKLC